MLKLLRIGPRRSGSIHGDDMRIEQEQIRRTRSAGQMARAHQRDKTEENSETKSDPRAPDGYKKVLRQPALHPAQRLAVAEMIAGTEPASLLPGCLARNDGNQLKPGIERSGWRDDNRVGASGPVRRFTTAAFGVFEV